MEALKRNAVFDKNGETPPLARVMLALTMISVCTPSEHWLNPVDLVNSEVIEQRTGRASAGTFLNIADIVARWLV